MSHEEASSGGESLRCRRVAEAIKEIAGRIVTQELADPRMGFITITRVRVTGDLRTARVFFSVLGQQGERSKATSALHHAAGFIRRRLGDELKLRFTPELTFEFDEGIDKSIRVSELLHDGSKDNATGSLPDKLPPLE